MLILVVKQSSKKFKPQQAVNTTRVRQRAKSASKNTKQIAKRGVTRTPSAHNWATAKARTSAPKDRHVVTLTRSPQQRVRTRAKVKSLPIKFNARHHRARADEQPLPADNAECFVCMPWLPARAIRPAAKCWRVKAVAPVGYQSIGLHRSPQTITRIDRATRALASAISAPLCFN